MGSVTVRPADARHDRAQVLAMGQAFWRQSAYAQLGREPTVETLDGLFTMLGQVGVVLVAETAPWQLVGFLALAALEHPLTRQPYADEIAWWVEPAHRRSGAGLELLAAGERWARAKGLGALKMVAPAGSPVAALYDRRGYRPIETAYVLRLDANPGLHQVTCGCLTGQRQQDAADGETSPRGWHLGDEQTCTCGLASGLRAQ